MKKSTTKKDTVASLQAKLSDYAATIERQAVRLRELGALVEGRDGEMNKLQSRVDGFIGMSERIRAACIDGGIEDAEAMPTVRAVERLVARHNDLKRTARQASNAVEHLRFLQSIVEANGYTVTYRDNGRTISVSTPSPAPSPAPFAWTWKRVLAATGCVLCAFMFGFCVGNLIMSLFR